MNKGKEKTEESKKMGFLTAINSSGQAKIG